MRRHLVLFAFVAALLAAACGGGDDAAAGEPTVTAAATETTAAVETTDAGDAPDTTSSSEDAAEPLTGDFAEYTSEVYGDESHWLCLPGRADDPCGADLDATSVAADGTLTPDPHEALADPPIDCFYVYPTISSDPTVNSDLIPNAPEATVVQAQVARLDSACRVFAPVYRQRTLSGLFGSAEPNPPGVPEDIAYMDVLDSFKDYIANRSDGRGFVLIGHSQGSGMLNRLIQEEIDDTPALRDRVVSAILMGSSVTVPEEGALVGGDFDNLPLCQADGEIGCVISFASFRSTAPPPDSSFFGRPREGDGVAACVNPADIAGGGPVDLTAYFAKQGLPGLTDEAAAAAITTDWVTVPGLLTGECVYENGFSYLKITINADPADPRSDDISGDITPEWGLHLVDANLVMGDLETVVVAQSATYTG